jgi:hypothetical protein
MELAAAVSAAAAPRRRLPAVPVPTYAAVGIIGWLMIVLGALTILGGIALAVLAVAGGAMADSQPPPPGMFRSSSPSVLPLILASSLPMLAVAIVSGIMQIGVGQLLLCIRDMAINSFYVRNQTA